VTAGLAVVALGVGAVKMVDDDYARPAWKDMARFLDERRGDGDVVIDETALLSPGPLSSIDPYLARRGPVVRAGKPQQRDHPFNVFDHVTTVGEATAMAMKLARGRRIFLAPVDEASRRPHPLGRYRMVERREWPGFINAVVQIYELSPSSRG